MIFRRKTEADGFVRGLILTHNMSRNEACSFFSIGRNRFDRVRNSNPLLPPSKKSINEHAVRPQDKELIRIFMKEVKCNHFGKKEIHNPKKGKSEMRYCAIYTLYFPHLYKK